MIVRTKLGLHSRIGLHYNFRRVVLSIHRQLHVVSPRVNNGAEVEEAAEAAATASTATTTTKSRWQVGRAWRRITAQIPLHAIDANVFRPHEVANHFA